LSEEAKRQRKISKVNLALAVIGLVAPAGYLVGLSYYQAVLSSYGVSSDSFPLQTQDAYVMAYYAIFHLLLVVTKFVSAIFEILFIEHLVWTLVGLTTLVTIFYLILRPKLEDTKNNTKIKKVFKSIFEYLHWDNNTLTRAITVVGVIFYWLMSVLLIVSALSAFWIALPLASYHKGKDIALEDIKTFRENGCEKKDQEIWTNCKSLVSNDGQILYEGILVAHNQGYVAFLTKDGTFVSKMPKDSFIRNKFAE